MEKLVYKFETFEGPLDALLFLISKNKLNIYDIPIAELLNQYLAYLSQMRDMDLDVTSDFLEMASRLVQIKSAMLLPKREGGDESDPRRELMMALIEYKTCKAMAETLNARNEGFNCFVRAPQPLPHDETYKGHHERIEIYNAYMAVRGKVRRHLPPPVSAFREIVGQRIISVTARIIHVIKRLIRGGERPLSDLYDDSTGRSEVVATFMAVLELVKSRKIVVNGENGNETVKIVRSVH